MHIIYILFVYVHMLLLSLYVNCYFHVLIDGYTACKLNVNKCVAKYAYNYVYVCTVLMPIH